MNSRLAAAIVLVLAACGSASPTTVRISHTVHCVEGVRPDRSCTPGTRNPAVTQATIHRTICVRGWTATVRPPLSTTRVIKAERMRAYGVGSRSPSLFELDHFLPLELGGGTADVGNLWPEAYAGRQGAKVKDVAENLLRARVCSGALTLAQAQHEMLTDWTAVH